MRRAPITGAARRSSEDEKRTVTAIVEAHETGQEAADLYQRALEEVAAMADAEARARAEHDDIAKRRRDDLAKRCELAAAGRAAEREEAEAASGSFNEQRALDSATERPALPTVVHLPKMLRRRVADILIEALRHHVEAEAQAAARWSDAAAKTRARVASQWLWLLPSLLLRQGGVRDALDGEGQKDRADSTFQVIRQRVQRAESGKWQALLTDYLRDVAAEDEGGPPRGRGSGSLPLDADATREEAY